MENLKNWLYAIVIIVGLITTVYAAWLLAIFLAILGGIYIVKELLDT